jgi:hypothetical protein
MNFLHSRYGELIRNFAAGRNASIGDQMSLILFQKLAVDLNGALPLYRLHPSVVD